MRKLTIDLDKCRDCAECKAACDYLYHPSNCGIARLRELAAQELLCRRCETRSCVLACPNEALEAVNDVLKRHNMRCTGCLSCSVACPFGTLIPAALQFRDSFCDLCAGREDGTPACVTTCPEKAVTVAQVAADAPDVHVLGENLAVRCKVWQKIEPAGTK